MHYQQSLPKRFDDTYPEKKFNERAISAANLPREYSIVNGRIKKEWHRTPTGYWDSMLLHEKLAVAEINLRTRGLIGLILGSSAKKLMHPPRNMGDFHQLYSDIDVLVLNEYGSNCPRPFEWGIDWFVRPPGLLAPTNGLVRLWYDITLKSDIKRSLDPAPRDPRLPFYLDTNEMKLKYEFYPEDLTGKIIGKTREQVADCIIRPGLYLPSSGITARIVKQTETVKQELDNLYPELISAMKDLESLKKDRSELSHEQVDIILHALDLLDKLNERHFVGKPTGKKTHGQFHHLLKDFQSRIDFINLTLELFRKGLDKCEYTFQKDYSYLGYTDTPQTNALYPVLDEQLLSFRPISGKK